MYKQGQYLLFKLGALTFGISKHEVVKVLPSSDLQEGGTNQFMAGRITYQDKIIPVIDTRVQIGMQAQGIDKQKDILLLSGSSDNFTFIGLLVDRVLQPVIINKGSIQQINEQSACSNFSITGRISMENKDILLLDILSYTDISALQKEVSCF